MQCKLPGEDLESVPANHLGFIMSKSQVGQENSVSSSLMKNHFRAEFIPACDYEEVEAFLNKNESQWIRGQLGKVTVCNYGLAMTFM